MTINNNEEYQQEVVRYEGLKDLKTPEYYESQSAIKEYENSLWDLAEPTGNKFDDNKF